MFTVLTYWKRKTLQKLDQNMTIVNISLVYKTNTKQNKINTLTVSRFSAVFSNIYNKKIVTILQVQWLLNSRQNRTIYSSQIGCPHPVHLNSQELYKGYENKENRNILWMKNLSSSTLCGKTNTKQENAKNKYHRFIVMKLSYPHNEQSLCL